MSLASLLSLGRKEPEKAAPKVHHQEQGTAVKPGSATKLKQEELDLLSHQVDSQSKVLSVEHAKTQQEQEASAKRALEEAAEQMSAIAKKRREETGVCKSDNNPRHKTTLCKFFFQSKCDKANFCPFAHSLEEVTKASNEQGSQAGVAYKKKFCRFFEIGSCINGDFCSYAHTYHELQGYVPPDNAIDQSGFINNGGQEWRGQEWRGQDWSGQDWSGYDGSGTGMLPAGGNGITYVKASSSSGGGYDDPSWGAGDAPSTGSAQSMNAGQQAQFQQTSELSRSDRGEPEQAVPPCRERHGWG